MLPGAITDATQDGHPNVHSRDRADHAKKPDMSCVHPWRARQADMIQFRSARPATSPSPTQRACAEVLPLSFLTVEALEASEVLRRNPAAMQLRYQQTLVELGGDRSTIVFRLP